MIDSRKEDLQQEIELPYRLGGLLYTPALNETIAQKIIEHRIPCLTSLVFCLEDSIMDHALDEAENRLRCTLQKISESGNNSLPLLFVRVRTPNQLRRLHREFGSLANLLTGYVFPKFDTTNAADYLDLLAEINAASSHKVYGMPILESRAIADSRTRGKELTNLRQELMAMKNCILNVRVGGNDFCNLFGLRRSFRQNIYEIGVVRDILIDIVNQFSDVFVVSGPVWEYFGASEDERWEPGLRRELELDRLNGFIGKTVIHPSQLPVVYESMKPSQADYEDACNILGWRSEMLGVAKSRDTGRMNEVKCHKNWARKIKILGDIYGAKAEAFGDVK